MQSRAFFWGARTVLVVFAIEIGALAQAQTPVHFGGVINDFTPAHDSNGNPTGPWELHGVWNLNLNGNSGMADFSAALTMENSDYWLSINSNPPANPDAPGTRTPHTHRITMENAQVISDPNTVASNCPTAAYKPQTTTGFMVEGSANVTANGGYAPFAPQGQLSPLTICITGGSQVEFSNITLVFGAPANGHFGSQAINGVVRNADE